MNSSVIQSWSRIYYVVQLNVFVHKVLMIKGKLIILIMLIFQWSFVSWWKIDCARHFVMNFLSSIFNDDVKPLSHQTAMPQRLYSVLKPCLKPHCGIAAKYALKISNLQVIACTECPNPNNNLPFKKFHF